MIKKIRTTADNNDFNELIKRLNAELRERYVDQETKFAPHNILSTDVKTVLIYYNNLAIACGAFREDKQIDTVEIKRMYVEKEYRSNGFGKIVLIELERWAAELKYKYAILETGNNQLEAIKLYQIWDIKKFLTFCRMRTFPKVSA